MTLITMLLFISRGITGPVRSLYTRSLGASYLTIGFLGTVTSLSMIGGNSLWGWLSDRIQKRKPILLGGLAALALGFVGIAVVPSANWLFPLYLWMALAQAAYDTASLALMGDLLEAGGRARGRKMGTYRGLASLAFGTAAFGSGELAEAWSLRGPFLIGAVALGCALLLAFWIRKPEDSDDETTPDRRKVQVEAATTSLSNNHQLPLPPLLIAVGIWSLVTGAVYAVWANYMVESLGYSQGQMTRLWAIASLSEFPLMILAGWLGDRLGRLPMLSIGLALWAGVFAGYLFLPAMPWIIGVQLVRGFAYSAHTATAMTYAAEVREREQRGRMSGFYGTAGSIGAILGTSLGGLLTEYAGFRVMIGTCAALVFVGAVYVGISAITHHARKRPVASADAS
jgi:MFS family permease